MCYGYSLTVGDCTLQTCPSKTQIVVLVMALFIGCSAGLAWCRFHPVLLDDQHLLQKQTELVLRVLLVASGSHR